MKIIGITGGVGSGKSRVLSYMETKYRAVICQADHVAWMLQEAGQKCYAQIVAYFGENILDEDGTINRGKLGQIVFADKDKLFKLNQIMHPAVKEYIVEWIQRERNNETLYFIIEAALLLEDDYSQICDEMWYIYCDENIRRERLKSSRGYTDNKIDAIMASQLSEEIFRKECHIVIDNSGDFEDTCYQIKKAMKR
jgi:dephospho-CoA kinase